MNVEQWEQDIVSRLVPDPLPDPLIIPEGVEVITMPETPNEYEREFADGRITVAFNNAKWRETKATDLVVQTADIDFAIIIQSRLLRGAKGVYALFSSVKKYLVGFEPTGCKKLRSKDFMLYSDEKDLFTFVYFMTCEFDAAEFYTAEEDRPGTVNIARIQGDEEILYDPNDANKTENVKVIELGESPTEEPEP